MATNVSLVSNEGELFDVSVANAKISTLISNLIDSAGDDDDEAQGWAWLFILPIVGGSLLLAWLLFTVVWAPCVFMISALSSPLWAGPILWATCQGILTWRQASEAIRVVALWPAYYIYVLGFYDFEDDYIDIEPPEDGTI